MKKSMYIILPVLASVSLAAVLLKKKSKSNLKITCKCCGDDSKQTEQVVTDKEIKPGEPVDVTLPISGSKGPISLVLNNAFTGNVTYNIVIK